MIRLPGAKGKLRGDKRRELNGRQLFRERDRTPVGDDSAREVTNELHRAIGDRVLKQTLKPVVVLTVCGPTKVVL